MEIYVNDLMKQYCELHPTDDDIDFSLNAIKLTKNNRYIFHDLPIYNKDQKRILINNDTDRDISGYYINADNTSLELMIDCRVDFVIYGDGQQNPYDKQFNDAMRAFDSILELLSSGAYGINEENIDKKYIITLAVASLLVGMDVTPNIYFHTAPIHAVYAFNNYMDSHWYSYDHEAVKYAKRLITHNMCDIIIDSSDNTDILYKGALNAILAGVLNNTSILFRSSPATHILTWDKNNDMKYRAVKDMLDLIGSLSKQDLDLELALRICGDSHLMETVAEIDLDEDLSEDELRAHYTKCITGQIDEFYIDIITSGPLASYIYINCNNNAILLFTKFSMDQFIIPKGEERDFHADISDLPEKMLWAVLDKLSYKKSGMLHRDFMEKIAKVNKICGYINDLIMFGILDTKENSDFFQPYIHSIVEEFANSDVEHDKILTFINKRIYSLE